MIDTPPCRPPFDCRFRFDALMPLRRAATRFALLLLMLIAADAADLTLLFATLMMMPPC